MFVHQKATRKKNYVVVPKAKTKLHLIRKYFTSQTTLLKQDQSGITLSPDLPSFTRSTIYFRQFQIVQPNVISHDQLRPASNKIHMTRLSHNRTRKL